MRSVMLHELVPPVAYFPSLAPLAEDSLAAPASQAYVERVFSVWVWSSHFSKEKSSLQETSQQSFSKSEQCFTVEHCVMYIYN